MQTKEKEITKTEAEEPSLKFKEKLELLKTERENEEIRHAHKMQEIFMEREKDNNFYERRKEIIRLQEAQQKRKFGKGYKDFQID